MATSHRLFGSVHIRPHDHTTTRPHDLSSSQEHTQDKCGKLHICNSFTQIRALTSSKAKCLHAADPEGHGLVVQHPSEFLQMTMKITDRTLRLSLTVLLSSKMVYPYVEDRAKYDLAAYHATDTGVISQSDIEPVIHQAYTDLDKNNIHQKVEWVCAGRDVNANDFLQILKQLGCLEHDD